MVIVIESPNKVKKIAAATGAKVVATVGHFKDLPQDNLGVDLTSYSPTFLVSQGKSDVIKRLKDACKGQEVVIATDPDREGYAIGTMVYQEIQKIAKSCARAEFHEITEKGIKAALAASVPFEKTNRGLYDAFLGRRVGDRLVGYILSPMACKELRGKYSVGRVQTPAVRLVVDREREIRAFKPEPYWVAAVILEKNGVRFKAFHVAGNMKDKKSAEAIMAAVKGHTFALAEKVTTKVVKQNPKAPFTTVDLQATASSQLKISPEASMKIAQDLFEAGLITYHRTDSVKISDEFVAEIRGHVTKTLGPSYLPATPNVHKSKNSQAEAHEAIRPSHMHSSTDIPKLIAKEGLSAEHEKVYTLIYRRTVASQMASAVYDSTVMVFDVAAQKFKSSGRVLKFEGFLRVYQEAAAEGDDDENQQLPAISIDEKVPKVGEDLAEKMTKAPGRYTEGSLVKALEKAGIGRPSTYASIMGTIKARGYVKVEKGKLYPEPSGEVIVDYLTDKFAWVVDYDLTKTMEDYLDKVEAQADGASWQKFCKGVHAKTGYFVPTPRTEGGGAPSEKQLKYARDIAQKKGVELPKKVEVNAQACREWIDKNLEKKKSAPAKKGAQGKERDRSRGRGKGRGR